MSLGRQKVCLIRLLSQHLAISNSYPFEGHGDFEDLMKVLDLDPLSKKKKNSTLNTQFWGIQDAPPIPHPHLVPMDPRGRNLAFKDLALG